MEQFEFNLQPCPMSILDIDNICQCAVEARNEEGEFYYLMIRTILGYSTVFKCGPVVPDVYFLPSGFETSLVRLDCDEDKLYKLIDKWLNDRFKKLTEAKVITFEEARSQFRDICSYMDDYGKEGVY